jgi:hypothetical protein
MDSSGNYGSTTVLGAITIQVWQRHRLLRPLSVDLVLVSLGDAPPDSLKSRLKACFKFSLTAIMSVVSVPVVVLVDCAASCLRVGYSTPSEAHSWQESERPAVQGSQRLIQV